MLATSDNLDFIIISPQTVLVERYSTLRPGSYRHPLSVAAGGETVMNDYTNDMRRIVAIHAQEIF